MPTNDILLKKGEDELTIDIEDEISSDGSVEIHKKRPVNIKQRSSYIKKKEHSRHEPIHIQKRNGASHKMDEDMLKMFTNPEKIVNDDDEENESEISNDVPKNKDYAFDDDDEDGENYNEDDDVPSNGYKSIDEEKQDLLYKLYRLQSKGVYTTKKFNMNSDISEIRSEYNRIKRDAEVKSSIKFSQRMLLACITGLEFINKRYDPFDVKLDGWSESVMEGIDDYDNLFERLHDKYAQKVQMAPEIELLLMISGSAFMFHLTNTMFKSIPNLNDIAKNNPDIFKNMMNTMSQQKTSTSQENSHSTGSTNQTTESNTTIREMKPPMFDLSMLNNMMTNPMNNVMEPPVHSRPNTNIVESITELPSSSSEQSDTTSNTKLVTLSENTFNKKRRRNSKIKSTDENTMSI